MSDLPKGYWQAVENLAYHILKMTQQTQQPHIENLSEEALFGENAMTDDELVEYCAQFQTAEERQIWDRLDRAFEEVVHTYGADPEELYNHVTARMFVFDVESGGYN